MTVATMLAQKRARAVDLIDRANRVKDLLEFLAGYALLVDACEDGATVDDLKMGYLGIPLLEAAEVVQELADGVNVPMPDPDESAPLAAD